MAWQPLDTIPIDFGTGIPGARALAIAQALTRRVMPLLRRVDGRAEPLATAALFVVDGRPLIVTCKHALDHGVALGDLGVPFGEGRIFWLRDACARVLEHPVRDLLCIALALRAATPLLAHWRAAPLRIDAEGAASARTLAVAGYPYAQMRRHAHVVYAKPVVLFTRTQPHGGDDLRLHYRRTAARVDGIEVHTPSLDGVSGAMCWAVTDEADDDCACLLLPVAVQFAFKHDAYARAEPVHAVAPLLERLKR